MHKIVFYIQLLLLAAFLTSCEEESEELQLNDLVNQDYEAKKNRHFAAKIGFEEFEAIVVEADSANGRWLFKARNDEKEVWLLLPFLKEQIYWADGSNRVEMAYLIYGGQSYHSNWAKDEPFFKVEVSRVDTTLNQLFGKFEGSLYSEDGKEEIFVDQGVFNRLQYQIE